MKTLPRFQVHLSTAILLMLASGVLMWSNFADRPAHWVTLNHRTLWCEPDAAHGWPFVMALRLPDNEPAKDARTETFNQFDYEFCAVNAVVALAILYSTWHLGEWWFRRRAIGRES